MRRLQPVLNRHVADDRPWIEAHRRPHVDPLVGHAESLPIPIDALRVGVGGHVPIAAHHYLVPCYGAQRRRRRRGRQARRRPRWRPIELIDYDFGDCEVARSAQLSHRHPCATREFARHKEGASRGGCCHWATATAMRTLPHVASGLPHPHLERAQPCLPLGRLQTIVHSDVVDFKAVIDLQRHPLCNALVADTQRLPPAVLRKGEGSGDLAGERANRSGVKSDEWWA